jgi:hypothetical protein
VREVDEDLNSLVDDVVAPFTSNAGDKSDAASIMLVGGIVESLGRGETVL